MITPRFSCSQNATSIIVSIYCPSVRASEVEINVDDTLFTVHINPYFLRLNFSNKVLEDDSSSAKYDPGSGHLTVTLTKEVQGQDFKDLDLLAKLLSPKPSENHDKPSIEVIAEDTSNDDMSDLVDRADKLSLDHEEILEAAKNDWQLPQEVPAPLPDLRTSIQSKYGFLDMYSGYFRHVSHTENEVNELGADADVRTPFERRQLREKHEDEKWDEEHYMADYADDEYIQELLSWKNPHTVQTDDFKYSEKENLAMLNLPRKEYLATRVQTHQLYLTLLTLLFSYAYDARSTQLDPTSESAWTIGILTPAFSALDPPPYTTTSDLASSMPCTEDVSISVSDISDALSPSYRRSLAFPLYRSFAFSDACRADVAKLLLRGKRIVFRCLLEMKDILDHHDTYYIYSKIWLEDFCVWIQACAKDDVLRALGSTLETLKMEKSAMGWDLEDLEAATHIGVQDRDPDSDDSSSE